MLHTSVIEISRSALQNNIQFIKGYLNPGVKLSCVVKGNAYGHGLETYVPLAEAAGVDHFSVFSTDEAYRVKQVCSENTTLLIMGYVDNEDVEWAIIEGVEFYVFEMDRLQVALEMAKKTGIKARVHLEVETGMNRTGFDAKDFKQAIALLKKFPENFSFEGVCTHFAGAESIANYVRIHNQIKKFNHFKKNFGERRCAAASFSHCLFGSRHRLSQNTNGHGANRHFAIRLLAHTGNIYPLYP